MMGKNKKIIKKQLKRGWRITLSLGNNYFLKTYCPLFAQDNLLGNYGDTNSCFKGGRSNSHHPSVLKKNGWKFLAISRNGKPHSRAWIKFTPNKLLVANIYSHNAVGRENFFNAVSYLLYGVESVRPKSHEAGIYDSVYTNGGVIYIYNLSNNK